MPVPLTGSADEVPPAPRRFSLPRGDALHSRATPYGSVGTLYADDTMVVVSVSKQAEAIDPGWFSQPGVDILIVVQGQLRLEFADQAAAPAEPAEQAEPAEPAEQAEPAEPMVLAPGDVLVLPPDTACRGYRWPRDADQATIFVAVYPTTAKTTANRERSAHRGGSGLRAFQPRSGLRAFR